MAPPLSPTSTPSRSSLALGYATIYLIWGSTYLANRVAIETLPPFLMPGARFLAAGTLLAGWLWFRGAAPPSPRQIRDNAIAAVFLLGGTGLVVWAQQYIPSGLTALIIGASPLFFAVVEWAWPGGEAPSAIAGVALVTGFAGVTWLAAPWQSAGTGGLQLLPTMVILVGSLMWAVGGIFSRHLKARAHPLVGASVQMLIGGSLLLMVGSLLGEWSLFSWTYISARSFGAFAYLVIAGSLIAFPTFIWLMQHSSPSRVSTYAYVNPVVAVALGWLILDEPLGPRTLVSAAVILAAVALITTQQTVRK